MPRAGILTRLRVPEEEVLNASKAGAIHWLPCLVTVLLLIHPNQPGNSVGFWSGLRSR